MPSATAGATITVTQTRSGIGTKPKHRGTLRALGLHGIGTSNTLPDRPEIRGMIARVPHLVAVAEAVEPATKKPVAKLSAKPDATKSTEETP
jgi:large subunit ribosomal protein L30